RAKRGGGARPPARREAEDRAQVNPGAAGADGQLRGPEVKRSLGTLVADDAAAGVNRQGGGVHERGRVVARREKHAERQHGEPSNRRDEVRPPDKPHHSECYTRRRMQIVGVALISCTLLMIELALTRIFSVTMYYHFAFLAISIALFGLSASGVAVYVARRRLAAIDAHLLLSVAAQTHALATLLALACLVRIRVGLNYSPENLELMLAIYALAALPFFTGGAVMSLAFARLTGRINVLYAADLMGAAAGCMVLIPLLNWLGAPGVVMTAAALSTAAAIAFAPTT